MADKAFGAYDEKTTAVALNDEVLIQDSEDSDIIKRMKSDNFKGPTGATGPEGPPGTGDMLGANNLSDVDSASLSRINLGLGVLSTLDTVGTTEIVDRAVTFGKMESIPTNRILGRNTAGNGDIEYLTIPSTKAMLAIDNVDNTSDATKDSATTTLTNKTLTSPVINVTSDATGDIYYRNASGLFTRLPIGTAGQILTQTAGVPTWEDASGGGGLAYFCGSGRGVSLPKSSTVSINFDINMVDPDSAYNTTTKVYTVPATGNYEIYSNVSLDSYLDNRLQNRLNKNGSLLFFVNGGTADRGTIMTICLPLVAGDTIGISARKDSTGTGSLSSTGSNLTIRQIS